MSICVRLTGNGQRAHASSSCRQAGYESLIRCLTEEVQVAIQGIPQLPDGRYTALYEGRGAHRDVYKFGNYILKLERKDAEGRYPSNTEEAVSLQRYGGVTYDKLLHQHSKSRLSVQMASFLVTAYRELSMMVLDGVQLNIAYGNLCMANIATLMDPAKHTHDSPVPSIVVDAKCVRREQCEGIIPIAKCADEMILDLELHCSKEARHHTWNLLGHYMHVYVNRIFRDLGQDDLASVRERGRSRFDLLWDAFTAGYSIQWNQAEVLVHPNKMAAAKSVGKAVWL